MAARSGSGAKEMILMWVQNRIKDYPVIMKIKSNMFTLKCISRSQ